MFALSSAPMLACAAVSENFGLASFSILAFFIVNWIVFYLLDRAGSYDRSKSRRQSKTGLSQAIDDRATRGLVAEDGFEPPTRGL
jgi:hypothetical protein